MQSGAETNMLLCFQVFDGMPGRADTVTGSESARLFTRILSFFNVT